METVVLIARHVCIEYSEEGFAFSFFQNKKIEYIYTFIHIYKKKAIDQTSIITLFV